MGTRFALPLALALAACTAHHDPNAVTVTNRDCYTCHKVDYEATPTWPASAAIPTPVDHMPFGNPPACGTGCASCHVAPTANTPPGTGWANNLGGCAHPEANFPLVANNDATLGPVGPSPHANIDCITCHDPTSPNSSAMGANTNCIQCHPNSSTQQSSHSTLSGYVYQASVQNFCLSCHPAGLALAHPESIFPSNHRGSTCTQCHDASISGNFKTNPNCLASGCHSQSSIDTSHANNDAAGRYPGVKANPGNLPNGDPLTSHDYCLSSGCHLGGGGGGN